MTCATVVHCCFAQLQVVCFCQVKSQQVGNCPKCPFCKADFAIYYHGEKTAEQRRQSLAEEQQQIQAAIRSKQVLFLLHLLTDCGKSAFVGMPSRHAVCA